MDDPERSSDTRVDGEEVTRGDEDCAPGVRSPAQRYFSRITDWRENFHTSVIRCHAKTATPPSIPAYAVPAGGSTVTSACALSHSMLFLASIASPACSTSLCTSYSVP